MPNAKSLANLIPYKPGQSGNAGSGNGYSLTSELKHELSKKEIRQQIVKSTIEGAILREPTPFKELWERSEGKVPDKTIPPQQNTQINIIVDSKGEGLLSKLDSVLKGLPPGG